MKGARWALKKKVWWWAGDFTDNGNLLKHVSLMLWVQCVMPGCNSARIMLVV